MGVSGVIEATAVILEEIGHIEEESKLIIIIIIIVIKQLNMHWVSKRFGVEGKRRRRYRSLRGQR